MNKLAVLSVRLGRYPEAGDLLRPALEIQLSTLGEDNPEVAATMANLAAVRVHQKLPEEADTLYRRALPIFEHTCGPNDAKVATVLSSYAWLLRQRGRKPEAKRLEARARAISLSHKNDENRLTADVSDLLSLVKK
jgi:tetratricopeptide (TPR) repeat protein